MEKKYNILLACEESQAVCIEFRKLGFNAFSCDILECSGNHPEWHIKGDLLNVLKKEDIIFKTENGENHSVDKWDLMIGFPPCTFLTVTANDHYNIKKYGQKAIKRLEDREKAIQFFLKLWNAPIDRIAIENPIGIMSTRLRKPNQIIHPYYFGDEFSKSTCLWLKNLPLLFHNEKPNLFDEKVTHVGKGEFLEWISKDGKKKRMAKWFSDLRNGDYSNKRSKTFPGIAKAILEQWSKVF